MFDRLWSKVEPTGFCWLWNRPLTTSGYGSFLYEGKYWGAHRFVYTYLVGPIPEGLVLDHLCRVRHCVNPDHLEPVTNAENQRRGLRNQNTIKSHCVLGHTYSGDNLYEYSDPRTGNPARGCKKCKILTKQKLRAAGAKY